MTFKKKTGLIPMAASLLFSIFVSSIFFTSCNNFMNGDTFLNELENALDYENTPYSNITLLASSLYTDTILPSVGTYNNQYRVSDTFSVEFVMKQYYDFLGWKYTDGTLSIVKDERDEEKRTYNVVFQVLQIADITIEPICKAQDQITVNFEADNAKVLPNETTNYYLGEEFEIECRENDGYYFYGWEASGYKTDLETKELVAIEDLSEIITIANPKLTRTTVKVLNIDAVITIKPKLIKRASVVSTSPDVYNMIGVYSNSQILINFDRNMDEECLYYTLEEMYDIMEVQYKDEQVYFLSDEINDNKCYGYYIEYRDPNGDIIEEETANSIVYKAIEIHPANDLKINFLKFYGAPSLNKIDTKSLSIKANEENLPPQGVDILIILDKSFHFTDEETHEVIPLTSDYRFTYKIDLGKDTKMPEFQDLNTRQQRSDIDIRIIPKELDIERVRYSNKWKTILDTNENLMVDVVSEANVESMKLWMRGVVYDGESGLRYFKYTISSIPGILSKQYSFTNETLYPIINSITPYKKEYYFSAGKEFQINELVELPSDFSQNAFYKIFFELEDNCGNKITDEKYFFIDNIVPELDYFTSMNSEAVLFCFPNYTNQPRDYEVTLEGMGRNESFIGTKKNYQMPADVLITDSTAACDSVSCKYSITFSDFAGHKTETKIVEDSMQKKGPIYLYTNLAVSSIYYERLTPFAIAYATRIRSDTSAEGFVTTSGNLAFEVFDIYPRSIDEIQDDRNPISELIKNTYGVAGGQRGDFKKKIPSSSDFTKYFSEIKGNLEFLQEKNSAFNYQNYRYAFGSDDASSIVKAISWEKIMSDSVSIDDFEDIDVSSGYPEDLKCLTTGLFYYWNNEKPVF